MFALGHRGLCATLIANMMLWGHFKKRTFYVIILDNLSILPINTSIQSGAGNKTQQWSTNYTTRNFAEIHGFMKCVFVVRATFWSHWITQRWNVNLDHAFVKVEKNLAIDSVILWFSLVPIMIDGPSCISGIDRKYNHTTSTTAIQHQSLSILFVAAPDFVALM